MSKTRYYEIAGISDDWDIHGGQFAILIVYVTLTDFTIGKLLAGIFSNEYQYRVLNNLDIADANIDSYLAHYDSSEYLTVSLYLDRHIIPALESLGKQDLMEQYGGIESFEKLLNPTPKNHLNNYWMQPDDVDYYYGADAIKAECTNISNLLKECIEREKPFEVYFA